MKRVGILRGGRGKNYHTSLRRGGEVIAHITEHLKDKYKPVDILVDAEGVWHAGGLPVEPAQLTHRVDIVWNTADPYLSGTLRDFSIPVISMPFFLPDLLASVAKVPRKMILPKSAMEVHQKFPAPWVVKNANGISIAKTYNELVEAFNNGGAEIVEEFIRGVPGAVHSVTNFRGEDVYVLPPHGFTAEEKKVITEFAKILHKHLDTSHYLKADFTLHPRLGIYINDITFAPDLRPGSHLETSLHSVGAKLHHIVEHILESK